MKLVLYPLAAFALATLVARLAPRDPLPDWLAFLLVLGTGFIVLCITTPARRR